ncbi:ferritin-like metal-binding protein YciE [Bosea sp. OAE752]|uniref:ferritin-like domain-containing protein n=1 Tax=Bosea sp. OAE752 TaxID=2663873 RepID=UPI003D1D29B1
MTSPEEHLMNWLRDAHAMEKQAETMLSAIAGRLEHYPELKARIEAHLQETRVQSDMLISCIERRGGDSSTMKDLIGRFAAMGQGVCGMMASDEVIKGAMAGYAFEHVEVAAYKVLIAAADHCGDPETSAVCQRILQQEMVMGNWLAEHMEQVTLAFLSRSAANEPARI